MRVHVDLPIDRPLRRGGNIVNPEGNSNNPKAYRQYGNWIRANGGPKYGSEKPKALGSGGFEEQKEGGSIDRQTPSASDSMDMEAEQVGLLMTIQIQNQNHAHPKNTQLGQEGVSVKSLARNLTKGEKSQLRLGHTKWRPPVRDEFKTNYDGDFFMDTNKARKGVIICNGKGEVMAALAKKISMASSVEFVEAIANHCLIQPLTSLPLTV
nr:hypothetical protein CFP56_33818 [Quercus suber]